MDTVWFAINRKGLSMLCWAARLPEHYRLLSTMLSLLALVIGNRYFWVQMEYLTVKQEYVGHDRLRGISFLKEVSIQDNEARCIWRFQGIQKSHSSLKSRELGWLVLHNIVVKDRLQCTGFTNGGCAVCDELKTFKHVMLNCKVARTLQAWIAPEHTISFVAPCHWKRDFFGDKWKAGVCGT